VVPASVATEAEENQGDWQTAQRDPQHDGASVVNVSVIMLSRRTALLQWWPREALMHKNIEIVFTPEYSNYKVVVGLVDPVGNTVELHDLKPYTYYQLDLRDRNGQKLYASVNFSTAVLDSKLALNFQPNGFPPVTVRPSEVAIVGIVLCVWASAVYVFFTQWGKIRGLIPYQPQYKYQEPLIEDVEANVSQCHHCDLQIRHVHTFDEMYNLDTSSRDKYRQCNLTKGKINSSFIYLGPRRSCVEDGYSEDGWWADATLNAIRKTKSAEHIGIKPTIIVNSSISEESENDSDEGSGRRGSLAPPSGRFSGGGGGSGGAAELAGVPGDGHEKENLLPNDQRSSIISKDFLNPPVSSDFYGGRMTRSSSRSSNEILPNTPAMVSSSGNIFGRARMVHASKNVFLKSIRKPIPASTQHPSNLYGSSSPVVVSTSPQPLKRYRCAPDPIPRRPIASANPALALANNPQIMENIPQTAALFNRMYKRTTTAPQMCSAGSNGTRLPGKGPRKKGRSTESSTESGHSRHAEMASGMIPLEATAARQRVGSFRSRLKKQQPIMMSEPPTWGGATANPETLLRSLPTSVSSVDFPCNVAVTVHEFIDSNQEICDL